MLKHISTEHFSKGLWCRLLGGSTYRYSSRVFWHCVKCLLASLSSVAADADDFESLGVFT